MNAPKVIIRQAVRKITHPQPWDQMISYHNLSKDYEQHHTSAETVTHIAFAHELLRRPT
jgi:hypothetical protein